MHVDIPPVNQHREDDTGFQLGLQSFLTAERPRKDKFHSSEEEISLELWRKVYSSVHRFFSPNVPSLPHLLIFFFSLSFHRSLIASYTGQFSIP